MLYHFSPVHCNLDFPDRFLLHCKLPNLNKNVCSLVLSILRYAYVSLLFYPLSALGFSFLQSATRIHICTECTTAYIALFVLFFTNSSQLALHILRAITKHPHSDRNVQWPHKHLVPFQLLYSFSIFQDQYLFKTLSSDGVTNIADWLTKLTF